jgi:septal ring factor EnvC (AmiA/AmiB activator)
MTVVQLLAFDWGPPSTWFGIIGFGTAIGLVIAYFASREYIRRTIQVLKDTIDSLERQLKAEKELAMVLAEGHAATIAAGEEKLRIMTGERDVYRKDLHNLRGEHTPLLLELQELKLRPDLNTVLQKEEAWHSRREQFYTDMAANQRGIIEAQRDTLRIIGEIKSSVEAELKQSNEVCAAVGKALQDIVEKLDERESATAERDTGMMDLLAEIRDRLPPKPDAKPEAKSQP